jgi:hypothetical protein
MLVQKERSKMHTPQTWLTLPSTPTKKKLVPRDIYFSGVFAKTGSSDPSG